MNTFLELKVENARLQERLQALRVRSQELSKNQFARGSLTFSNGTMSAQLAANLGFDGAPEYAHSSYYNQMPAHGYGQSVVGYLPPVEDDADERRAAKRVSFVCSFTSLLLFVSGVRNFMCWPEADVVYSVQCSRRKCTRRISTCALLVDVRIHPNGERFVLSLRSSCRADRF